MKDWHREALRLRSEGALPNVISAKLGKGLDTVKWCLDENGEREKARERVRKMRGGASDRSAQRVTAKRKAKAVSAQPVRKGLHPAVIDYSNGTINRAEMVRRLRDEP